MTLSNERTQSQLRAIRAYLEQHGRIDKPTALAICDCDRLGARIWDLRHDPKDPMEIKTEMKEKTNRFGHLTRYAEYRVTK